MILASVRLSSMYLLSVVQLQNFNLQVTYSRCNRAAVTSASLQVVVRGRRLCEQAESLRASLVAE